MLWTFVRDTDIWRKNHYDWDKLSSNFCIELPSTHWEFVLTLTQSFRGIFFHAPLSWRMDKSRDAQLSFHSKLVQNILLRVLSQKPSQYQRELWSVFRLFQTRTDSISLTDQFEMKNIHHRIPLKTGHLWSYKWDETNKSKNSSMQRVNKIFAISRLW